MSSGKTPMFGAKRARDMVPVAVIWIAIVLGVLLLREAKPFLLPVAVSLILATVLASSVEFLYRHRIPEPLGAAIVIALIAAVLAIIAAILVQPAAEWLANAPANMERLAASFARFRETLPFLGSSLPHDAAAGQRGDPLQEKLAVESIAFTQSAVSHLGALVFAIVATLFLLYFILISERWLISHGKRILPATRVDDVSRLLKVIRREISHYFSVLTFVNIALGATTAMILALIGLPNPVFWGALVATLNFIPYLGPATSFSLLLCAGILHFSTIQDMLAPCIGFALAAFAESSIFSPWIIGSRLRISKLVVFISVVFWGWIWGIGGMIVSVPIVLIARRVLVGNSGDRLVPSHESPPLEVPALLRNGESRHGPLG